MTPERAIDICRRINARYFLALGLSEQPQLPSLEGVTLAEMLEAAEQVRKINALSALRPGASTVYVVPADRVIAAVYTVANYDPDCGPIAIEPRQDASGHWQMNAVSVIDVTQQDEIGETRCVA
tara:strand:+ start:4059 stop:4430 length:372 start_codon:yes stop_codon:yes gene_type:complete